MLSARGHGDFLFSNMANPMGECLVVVTFTTKTSQFLIRKGDIKYLIVDRVCVDIDPTICFGQFRTHELLSNSTNQPTLAPAPRDRRAAANYT